MRATEEIMSLVGVRKRVRGALTERMTDIARNYDAEVVIPLPEIDKADKPAVANFFAQGIDQHGARIASVMPDIIYPPVKNTDKALKDSRTRRKAALGWWQESYQDLVLAKRGRQLIAYASSPVLITPDPDTGCPRWEVRPAYDAYPCDNTLTPDDVLFCSRQSVGWLKVKYPDVYRAVTARRQGGEMLDSAHIDLIEYIDGTQRTLIVAGVGIVNQGVGAWGPYDLADTGGIVNVNINGMPYWATAVVTTKNLAGMCTAIVPSRISLNEPKGQFDDARGLFAMMAKLMALDVNAVANAVYPETWFIREPQSTGRIITPADPFRGVMGEAEGGTIEQLNVQPGFQTSTTIDRLERSLRQNTAMPAELGGESGSNIRTDRRGQSILSAAIDFYVAEHQTILSKSMAAELAVAAEVEKAYGGTKPKSYYVNFNKTRGQVDYVPNQLWDGPHPVRVEYASVGMDANALTVMIGQELSLGLLSRKSARRQMPNVLDPEYEEGQHLAEALDDAALSGLQQQAASGAVPFTDIMAIKRLIRDGDMSLEDAVDKVHQAAQARQATVTATGEPATAPPGSPDTQPGLAQPDQGAEVPPDVAAPSPSLENLRGLLGVGRTVRGSANA